MGIGLAMDFAIPLPVVSIFIAFTISRVLKMNSLAAVISATALKPFFPVIMAVNIYVQTLLVSAFPKLGGMVLPLQPGTGFWGLIFNKILSRGIPYLMAGLINGFIVFMVSSSVIYYLLKIRIERLKNKKTK